MAAQRRARSKKEDKGPIVDHTMGRQIWNVLKDESVLKDVLKEADPGRRWEKAGKSFKTNCPYHEDDTPSFHVNAAMGIAKCFGCGHWLHDPIQLIAKIRKCTYEAALLFLNDRLDLDKLYGKSINKLTEHHAVEELKKAAAVAFVKVVEEYVRDRPQHLKYMDAAAAYLENGRGVPVPMLCNLPVTIFPKPEHVKKYLEADFHDPYDKYFSAVNNIGHWGSVLFWYNDSPGTISRFKFRNKASDIRTVLAGADPWSLPADRAKRLFQKTFTFVEDPIDRPIGFFGLHHYSRLLGENNTSVVVTEGEFDALSVMVGQLRNGSTTDFPILATGGMGTTVFDLLKDCWVRTVYLVADAPGAKRGDQIARKWLSANVKVNGSVYDDSIMFRVFLWPSELVRDSGDLDDAVRIHGYDAVRKYVWSGKGENYLNSGDWVMDKCEEEVDAKIAEHPVEGTGAQARNSLKEQQSECRKVLADWFPALHSNIDQRMFIHKFSEKLKIDLNALGDVYNQINDVSTPRGAVAAVSNALFDLVSIPYYTMKNGKTYITVYSKLSETVIETPFSQDYGIEQTVSKFVNDDMTEWMKGVLNNAPTITPSKEDREKFPDEMAIMADEQRRAAQIIRKVITTNIHNFTPITQLQKVGQGIHYKDLTLSENTVYVVNGMKVFKGELNHPSGAPVVWTRIHDIADGKYYFECAENLEWSYTVRDVESLNAGMEVDIVGTYDKIARVLDGWEFQDHDVMRRYIAAWIMSLPIQLAIDRVTVTCITGESTSGKTSFLQGLLGGSRSMSSRIPSIIEPAKVVTDATEAYLAQTFDCTSMFVGIDEAETDDDADHNKRVKNLIRMLYSTSTGGANTGRGSPNHTGSIEMQYKCPTLLAAIHLPTDETFLTRTTIFYTKKNYKWKDIGEYIFSVLGSQKELTELRHAITTGLLSRMDEIRERSDALLARLKLEETETKTTDRFRESLVVALTLYEMAGTREDPHDPVALYHDIVRANKARLEIILAADLKHPLLDTILYTKCIPAYLGGENGPRELVSARDLLVGGEARAHAVLNDAKTGVYYIQSRKWIILYWRQLRTGVLSMNPVYRGLSEGALRESISKNKYLVNDISEVEHRYILREMRIGDAKMQAAYSVISLEYLIDSDQDFDQMEEAGKRQMSEEEARWTQGEGLQYDDMPNF